MLWPTKRRCEHEHPPHRQPRRSGALRNTIAGTLLAITLVASTGCAPQQSWSNPYPAYSYEWGAHEVALHQAANSGDVDAIWEFIRRIWPPELHAKLAAVITCESHFDPRANNGGHGGLLQIQFGTHDGKYFGLGYPGVWWWSVEANLWVGYVIWTQGGWWPWSCA